MILPHRLLLFALLSTAPALGQSAPTNLPARWFSGDTHTHIQRCRTCAPGVWCPDPDYTMDELFAEQCAGEVGVSCQLVWNPDGLIDPVNLPGIDDFLANYAPLVTGQEDPVSQPHADKILMHGLEVSGFAASQFGHITGIGIQDAAFPVHEPYPGPILEFLQAQPGALTGYAHAGWPVAYQLPPWYGLPNPTLPFLAPIDVALGRAEYLEVNVFDHEMPLPGFSWTQLYYSLLNAGQRPSLTGGSDNCDDRTIGTIRTYVHTESDALSFPDWVEGIRRGHTSLAYDRAQFLDLSVENEPIGSRLALSGPQSVTVQATLYLGAGATVTDTLEIVQDGAVVASKAFSLTGETSQSFTFEVPVQRSGWIAARTFLTHTAAVYLFVDDRPIATFTDADYWVRYCDDLSQNLGSFTTGDRTCAIQKEIERARRVFRAAAAYRSPLPTGVTRYGHATPSCEGPSAVCMAEAATSGQTLRVSCLNAPPDSLGWLLVGVAKLDQPRVVRGADLWVDISGNLWTTYFPLQVRSSAGGHAEIEIAIPDGMSGIPPLFGQWVWFDPTECVPGKTLSASDALEVLVQ